MASRLGIQFESAFETYEAIRPIGEGGSGRVYEARVGRTEQLVAVKCLSPNVVSDERRKRFKNEINFCQRQVHPNIVQVVDAGVALLEGKSCPFYVMKLFDETLRSRLPEISENDVLPIFGRILDGVEAAHLRGVWHRDLKPENILIERHGDLVVADFGIAHFEEESILTAVETRAASRLANFQYSAPEQRIRGGKVGPTADIFALGLILNELFSKSVAQGSGFRKVADVSPRFAYVDEIVDKMLRQDPSARYSTIEEVKKDLIGRGNEFIALQKLDASRREVVKLSDAPAFEPLRFIGLDVKDDVVKFSLNRPAPPGWADAFKNPRGGHSGIYGYGPERFTVGGNIVSIAMHGESDRTIQQVVDFAKQYAENANRSYVATLEAEARKAEQKMRKELEARVAAEERRKDLLSKIRL